MEESYTFGRDMMKYFPLNPKIANLNHGSWGVAPKEVIEKRRLLQDEIDSSPDDWFRRNRKTSWMQNRDCAAKFLGTSPQNVVLVHNTTEGINAVLKSLVVEMSPGDQVLCQPWTYKAIKNAALDACSTIDLKIPIKSTSEVVQAYKDAIARSGNVKIALIDYISSATATVFPIKELIALCKENNLITLIDGAHCPGQITVNLEELDADFFIGNFHKWAYAPRGCAALYVNPRFHSKMRPAVRSHVYAPPGGYTLDDFIYNGTTDDTCLTMLQAGLEFQRKIGGMSAIRDYIDTLLNEAVALITQTWGTGEFPIPAEMKAPYMRLVELPVLKDFPLPDTVGKAPFGDLRVEFFEVLFTKYGVAVTAIHVDGRPWIRLGANVYSTIRDFERLANAVKELM